MMQKAARIMKRTRTEPILASVGADGVITKVTRLARACAVLLALAAPAASAAAPASPAEQLYEQLGAVGLDPERVYRVREASLDRGDMHITLDDGTIAFTADVMGRVTGAFFAGQGELLVVPPNRAERSSVALFTGAAVLEEQFNSAYLRFNDDTFRGLQSELRPTTAQAEFVAKYGEAGRLLARADAFRLLLAFSRDLPPRPAEPSAEERQRSLPARAPELRATGDGGRLLRFDRRGTGYGGAVERYQGRHILRSVDFVRGALDAQSASVGRHRH